MEQLDVGTLEIRGFALYHRRRPGTLPTPARLPDGIEMRLRGRRPGFDKIRCTQYQRENGPPLR